ncbi:hypothetical protein AB0F93_00355 [Micromonospora tulbaghiae]|uniref:hypothetical protein n=1 Tax=Micromonospora tulbaghiae TaxID=479978 RepID=UPI00331B1525
MTVAIAERDMLKSAEVMGLAQQGKFREAAALARQAAAEFPAFRMPTPTGKEGPTFAMVAGWCDDQAAKLGEPAAVAEPVQEKAPESAPVETTTLRLVHDGDKPTSIFGVEKDSPAHKAIGSKKNGGLGWFWFGGTKSFYLPRSGGFAADMGAIGEAVRKLESIERDGVQLYRVEQQISTVGPDGTPLPKKLTAAEKKAWQQRLDGMRNEQLWLLNQGKGSCGCGMTGLSVRTGKSVTVDGQPVIKCYTCTGDPAPVVESAPVADLNAVMAGMLALPAGPAEPVAEQERPLSKKERKAAKKAAKLAKLAEESAPAPAPVVVPAPVVAPAPVADSIVGKVWRFALADGLSGQRRNDVATEVRRDLNSRVVAQFPGMAVQVRRDKEKHQLVVSVLAAPEVESPKVRELTTMIVGTALGVRGVARRMSAPRA